MVDLLSVEEADEKLVTERVRITLEGKDVVYEFVVLGCSVLEL